MTITSQGLCRGQGKIYALFRVEPRVGNNSLLITNASEDGRTLPVRFYPFDEEAGALKQVVVVIPILSETTQVLSFFENSNGRAVLLGRKRVSASSAKWRSRFNYRFNKELATRIRDYDEIGEYRQINVCFRDVIPDVNADILRMVLTLPYFADSDVRISCFDGLCNEVQISSVVLNDAKLPSILKEGLFTREMQVSVRVSKASHDLVFLLEDLAHPEIANFAVLELGEYEDRLRWWNESCGDASQDPRYNQWFLDHRASEALLLKQRETYFDYRPVYSFVVPLYKTPILLFSKMFESVVNQSYGRWELVLVNASPEDVSLSAAVDAASLTDSRVKVVTLSDNKGISENTLEGLNYCRGDFVCFLDHDDLIEPDALYEYTKAINAHPDIDALYCDEDKLLPDGSFSQPLFKPCFSIDRLRANNYVCHMLCVRKTVLDDIDYPTSEYDGAQDHDVVLKVSEKSKLIYHVPKILYHWRITEGSTAQDHSSKPYAALAGVKAVQSHLDRTGVSAEVELTRYPFTYRVRYAVPNPNPLVSIIIPSKDNAKVLDTCIRSILEKTTYDNYEIVVIENNSTLSGTFEYYKEIEEKCPQVRVEYWEHEFNFSKLMNFGAEKSRGDYLLLLNNDTELITADWLETLVGVCSRKEVGVVGVKLLYGDDTIQHAGVFVAERAAGHVGLNLPASNGGYFNILNIEHNLSAVTAACLMTKRSDFEAVGGFTEKLAVAFNDIDYCLKIRELDRLVVYTPYVQMYHYESLSRGYEDNVDKQVRFHRECSYLNYRWPEYFVKGDPYGSINFAITGPECWYWGLARR